MSDDIQRLSDELARDPGSMVFLELGEQLRRRQELDLALRIALRGLERHSHCAEAHDLLARISVDLDDLDRAFDEWDMVLRLAPDHVGARKGIGYVLFKQGRIAEAEEHLARAAALDPGDETIACALAKVRLSLSPLPGNDGPTFDQGGQSEEPGPADAQVTAAPDAPPVSRSGAAALGADEDARMLFAEVVGQGEQTALLVDADGLVTAGIYVTAEGDDVSHEVGAALSVIREEAVRATQHVQLGEWQAVVVEAEAATIALAPANGATVMLAAAVTVPLGLVRRTLERCRARAIVWLETGA